MAITGTTFDKAPVPSNRDSILFDRLILGISQVIKGRRNEMEIHSSGLNATVDTGLAIVQGRLIEITSPETITIPANTKGYISLTLDLSQSNPTSGTPFQDDYKFTLAQAKVEFVSSLVEQDTNENNPIYTFNLAAVSSSSSTLSITKNDLAYKNYVNAFDGVITGANPKAPDSILENDKWSRGKSGALKVATLDTGLKIVDFNDDTKLMPVTASQVNMPTDTNGWVPVTLQSPFRHYSDGQTLSYKVKNGHLTLSGAVSTTRKLASGNTNTYIIGYLPTQYAPGVTQFQVTQGSGTMIGLATIDSGTGAIMISRQRKGSSWSDYGVDTWLPMTFDFVIE